MRRETKPFSVGTPKPNVTESPTARSRKRPSGLGASSSAPRKPRAFTRTPAPMKCGFTAPGMSSVVCPGRIDTRVKLALFSASTLPGYINRSIPSIAPSGRSAATVASRRRANQRRTLLAATNHPCRECIGA